MAASLLLAACSAASAQWVWKEGERKVFSDTPPPASVPDKNIIKRPGGNAPLMAAQPATEIPVEGVTTTAAPASSPAAAPQLPKVDKELEARKKQAEEAEEARRKAEEQRVARVRADSCERARKAKATMDSGVRLATTNAKGEREVMDDKTRAAEARRMDDIMRSDCGPLAKAN
jgi:type IV secretory pathway VirB10-like protein